MIPGVVPGLIPGLIPWMILLMIPGVIPVLILLMIPGRSLRLQRLRGRPAHLLWAEIHGKIWDFGGDWRLLDPRGPQGIRGDPAPACGPPWRGAGWR